MRGALHTELFRCERDLGSPSTFLHTWLRSCFAFSQKRQSLGHQRLSTDTGREKAMARSQQFLTGHPCSGILFQVTTGYRVDSFKTAFARPHKCAAFSIGFHVYQGKPHPLRETEYQAREACHTTCFLQHRPRALSLCFQNHI